jgi:hypothetical protein
MKAGRFWMAFVLALVALPVAAVNETTTTAPSATQTSPHDVVRHATAQVLALIESSQSWAK